MPRELRSRADIEELISTFYLRAFDDPLIGPIFTDIAKMDLAQHLPIMCDFWESVLFAAGRYRRNAMQVHLDLHARVALQPEHFARWLELWSAVVDERFAGESADRAKRQAARIAGAIRRRLDRSPGDFASLRPLPIVGAR
ncbi:MAG: group III truncated hemoglobin [Candidatus Dormibacteraceae bacterium]